MLKAAWLEIGERHAGKGHRPESNLSLNFSACLWGTCSTKGAIQWLWKFYFGTLFLLEIRWSLSINCHMVNCCWHVNMPVVIMQTNNTCAWSLQFSAPCIRSARQEAHLKKCRVDHLRSGQKYLHLSYHYFELSAITFEALKLLYSSYARKLRTASTPSLAFMLLRCCSCLLPVCRLKPKIIYTQSQ